MYYKPSFLGAWRVAVRIRNTGQKGLPPRRTYESIGTGLGRAIFRLLRRTLQVWHPIPLATSTLSITCAPTVNNLEGALLCLELSRFARDQLLGSEPKEQQQQRLHRSLTAAEGFLWRTHRIQPARGVRMAVISPLPGSEPARPARTTALSRLFPAPNTKKKSSISLRRLSRMPIANTWRHLRAELPGAGAREWIPCAGRRSLV